MAEIDKTLPNIMTQLTPEQETEQVIADTEILNPSGETEVLENEDGSVDIDFDPNALQNIQADHNSNLADFLPEDVLGSLGSELFENYLKFEFGSVVSLSAKNLTKELRKVGRSFKIKQKIKKSIFKGSVIAR